MHDICLTCKKDLTQEYVDGIKDGDIKKSRFLQAEKQQAVKRVEIS